MQHDQTMLRDYLVSSVEDPRLNFQSILTRHFLVYHLFGVRYQELQEAELAFALALNWLLKHSGEFSTPEDASALLHALTVEGEEVNGVEIPYYMDGIFRALPWAVDGRIVPNYVRETLEETRSRGNPVLSESCKSLFQGLWRKTLSRCKPQSLSVLEPACGSANDYRFIDAFGLGRLFAYKGFDLCENNVLNARNLFPNVDFRLGNVFEIAAPDKSYDLCFVHDLFEHLSIKGMEAAIAEMCRVTRRELWVVFFNMAEEPKHVIQPVEDYHWNRLSFHETRKSFLRHSRSIQAIHIGSFLREGFPDAEAHNENAYAFRVEL